MPTKYWTPKMRQKAAERCKKQQPWKKATGPKTAQGKETSSQNALKHGERSAISIDLRKALHAHHLHINKLAKSMGLNL